MWQVLLIFVETLVLSWIFHMVPNDIQKRGRNDPTVVSPV